MLLSTYCAAAPPKLPSKRRSWPPFSQLPPAAATFSLTMTDLLVQIAAKDDIDPDELVEVPRDDRRHEANTERLAIDQTEQVIRTLDQWEEKASFAQSKRNRKSQCDSAAAQGRYAWTKLQLKVKRAFLVCSGSSA